MTQRTCGECTLCCKLLPMSAQSRSASSVTRLVEKGLIDAAAAAGLIQDFDKPAGARCPYQRHHKGCTVYARRPFGCRAWGCRWLTGDDTAELSRPDRSHYVIDENPDFVRAAETGDTPYPVLQIWVDPSYPDAHRDPALRAFLARQWEQGFVGALIRYNSEAAIVLFQQDGVWYERETNMRIEGEHTAEEKWRAGLRADPADARQRLEQAFGPSGR
jgi:Putative zinc- or iron-chelating domain